MKETPEWILREKREGKAELRREEKDRESRHSHYNVRHERLRVNSLLSKNVRCVVMALPGHLIHQPS